MILNYVDKLIQEGGHVDRFTVEDRKSYRKQVNQYIKTGKNDPSSNPERRKRYWKNDDVACEFTDFYSNRKDLKINTNKLCYVIPCHKLQPFLDYITNLSMNDMQHSPELNNYEYNKKFWKDLKDYIKIAISNEENIEVCHQ